jgi:lipoprotein-anchoring transpeptidase ErfK/SrfK
LYKDAQPLRDDGRLPYRIPATQGVLVRSKSLLVGAVAVALLVAGCQDGGRQAVVQPGATVTPTPAPAPTTPAPAPPVVPTRAAPSPTAIPTPAPPTYDVKAVQTQLTTLKYYIGAIDGDRGPAFESAVMAFQKVNGLGADGSVGKFTLAALKHPKTPTLKGTGGGTRVEVDLTKQVLYVVTNGVVARILPISSGNGMHYLTKEGYQATALSPVGYYQVQWRYLGERHAPLGTLYDPQYFYKGWAIHGSNSVPAYPASHGCIRVTRTDAKYLLRAIGVGTRIYIYGGTYTFTAGSAAPGTDDPGGDPGTHPSPSPTRSPSPRPTTTPTHSPTPLPTVVPTP